jgi:hypothetical protein
VRRKPDCKFFDDAFGRQGVRSHSGIVPQKFLGHFGAKMGKNRQQAKTVKSLIRLLYVAADYCCFVDPPDS